MLDRQLQVGAIEFESIHGANAGAMNGVMPAGGLETLPRNGSVMTLLAICCLAHHQSN